MKKFILGYLIIALIFGLFVVVATNRIEQINNGKIKVVPETYMNRWKYENLASII